MPSRPRSSAEESRREVTSMKTLDVATLALLSNTRTRPVFSTTYQRAELLGACIIATGCENARLGNTRCLFIDTEPSEGAPARQVAFAGRASRPETAVGTGVGVGAGVGVGVGTGAGEGAGADGGGGVVPEPESPPPHPASMAASAWHSRLVAIRGAFARMRETS